MSLTSGARVGPYEILSSLGTGGMGQVYRAHDGKLNRDVAIKVLPDAFANDADRLARFEREARTLAALNHPNIAHIYGIEDTGGAMRALVMELVEGPTLADRLALGPVPVDEALAIAKQIASALEAAHEQGIVHRDLKPANVKVRDDGTVKVLDFGLAKALGVGDASGPREHDAPSLATMTSPAHTATGMILGTAAYMAPEQAKGKPVDRRADIWAFGVVLYEMLTGRRAFRGDDVSDMLAAVLKTDPDWTAIPPDAPPAIRRLLRRCLEKDPRKRLASISDARLELDDTESPAGTGDARSAARPSLVARLWPAAAGVVLTAAVAATLWPAPQSDAGGNVSRLSVLPPPGAALYPESTHVAISPNGRMVAFVVGSAVRRAQNELWVRSLDSMTARRLEGAEGVGLPFWSPDSRRIGYFANEKLMVIPAEGGRAEVLCPAPFGRGAAWSPSNVIVFAPDAGGPLYRVSANGGEPEQVTTLDAARKESGHRFPAFLPDGDRFLYAALPARGGKFDIYVGSLRDKTLRVRIGSMESTPAWADPGWLLFTRRGVLAAQAFDPATAELKGEAVSLVDEPTSILDPTTTMTAGRLVSISSDGSLAYFSAPPVNTSAVWLDGSGRTTGPLPLPAGQYSGLSISPDGTRAVVVRSISATESNLWLVDLARGSASPLSSGGGRNDAPVWSPDGTRVAFASDRKGPQDLYLKVLDDASPEQPLYESDTLFKKPDGWSPDGKWFIFGQLDPDTAYNIWLLPTSGGGKPTLYAGSPTRDMSGTPSPDGKWLVYLSEETGRMEVLVRSFPTPGPGTQLSDAGASQAWWTKDGRRVIFVDGSATALFSVDVTPGPAFRASVPRRLGALPPGVMAMDAMPTRDRFLALVPERMGAGSVTIVQNWKASLQKTP